MTTDELQAAETEAWNAAWEAIEAHFEAEIGGGTTDLALMDAAVAAMNHYAAAIRATEAARYRRLVEAIETEHEEWHRQYDGTRNGVALPIAQCRNGLCAALAENPEPAALPDEAMVERVAEAMAKGDPVWTGENDDFAQLMPEDQDRYREMARAALAVITEPVERDSSPD